MAGSGSVVLGPRTELAHDDSHSENPTFHPTYQTDATGRIRRHRTSPAECSNLIIPRSWVRSPPALQRGLYRSSAFYVPKSRFRDTELGSLIFGQPRAYWFNCGTIADMTSTPHVTRTFLCAAVILIMGTFAAPTASALKTQTAAQSCKVSQLSVKPMEGLATQGTKYYLVSLKNVSSTSCTLKGYPQLRMLDAAGKSIATLVIHRGAFGGAKATGVTLVTIKPGWSALFSLAYPDSIDYTRATCPISDHVEILVPNMKGSVIFKWRIQPYGGATVVKLHCGEIGVSFLSGPYHLTKSQL